MDRFEYKQGSLNPNESFVIREKGVRLYDGEHKVSYIVIKVKSLVHSRLHILAYIL